MDEAKTLASKLSENNKDTPLYIIQSSDWAYYVDDSDFVRSYETLHAKYLKGKSVKL